MKVLFILATLYIVFIAIGWLIEKYKTKTLEFHTIEDELHDIDFYEYEFEELILYLKSKFTIQGVSVNKPASIEDIVSFEKKHNIVFPEIMKQYFLLFNGTGESNCGDDGFAFFSLSELELTFTHIPNNLIYTNCFVFSDYLMWCWGYAIQLNKDGTEGDIYLDESEDKLPIKVANSFTEFLHKYLSNSDDLI